MDYQWYPGHMTKARREMQEDIRLIDLVIELTDARAPESGRNPDIEKLSGQKARLILLNKADLADDRQTSAWQAFYQTQGFRSVPLDSRSRGGMKTIQAAILEACRMKLERDRARGILNRPLRAMVAGIPNVGKSTFINTFAGKACAKTGNKPGVTRGRQWIRLNREVELLDTPGILWPKFDDPLIGQKLAALGSIKDELLRPEELALWVLSYVQKNYPGLLALRYRMEETGTPLFLLEQIAQRRGCLKKGGISDTERAASLFLDDFRSGRLGKITLEQPGTSSRKPLADPDGKP